MIFLTMLDKLQPRCRPASTCELATQAEVDALAAQWRLLPGGER